MVHLNLVIITQILCWDNPRNAIIGEIIWKCQGDPIFIYAENIGDWII